MYVLSLLRILSTPYANINPELSDCAFLNFSAPKINSLALLSLAREQRNAYLSLARPTELGILTPGLVTFLCAAKLDVNTSCY